MLQGEWGIHQMMKWQEGHSRERQHGGRGTGAAQKIQELHPGDGNTCMAMPGHISLK